MFLKKYSNLICRKTIPHDHYAIRLQKGQGPCSFLNNRKCSIYDMRPYFCRQFPTHFHVLNRIQIIVDLSCRGVWTNYGEDLEAMALEMANSNLATLIEVLDDSRVVYCDFVSNCVDAGIWRKPVELQKEIDESFDRLLDVKFLARMLDMTIEKSELSIVEVNKSDQDIKYDDIVDAAMEATLGSIGVSRIVDAPIYCDEEGNWNAFYLKNKKIIWYRLNDDGSLEQTESIDPRDVELILPDASAKRILAWYLSILNKRDSTFGYACYLVDQYKYQDFLSNVYFGIIGTALLDLLFRSSLLIRIKGGKLDENLMKEAIIFFDMDLLDAPTIGAYV